MLIKNPIIYKGNHQINLTINHSLTFYHPKRRFEMRGHEPRSSSSCAACKLLKRRCTPTCIFAPHFRSSDQITFAKVHKVFGASNVSKLLSEVPEEQRQETVNSLAYEADVRLNDPVYGCIGAIASLQKKMLELQHDIAVARNRLLAHNAAGGVNNNNSHLLVSPLVDDASQLAAFLDLVPYSDLMLLDGSGLDAYLFDIGQPPFV
uniref:Transcription factor LBD21 n=1 Tax=Brassica rapa var. rapa TaxID=1652998 RepID=A0A291LR03_BRARR|nr:transcription factor LBD21 [Brassica rapa var. rapa]